MLTSETKRRIDACRDILVGKLPQPSNQVELITLALIYKFMDDLDEESVKLGGKRSFFTGELAKYRWRNLLPQTVSADERVTLFSEGVEALGHAQKAAHLPGLFRDIFRNAFLKFRDGRILTMFLTEINGFAYSHSEELGNAFEYLLQCTGAQGENGQFRTPRHIIDFIVACLDPQPGDRILDPACGTGGFLVSAYRHILAHSTSPGSTMPGDKLTHAQRQKVYGNLAGYDVDDQMVKLSKVNLFLHGFPDPAIHIYDTLSNDARWNEKADLILANPPFMTPKGGVTPHTKFRIAAKKAEVLFTDYIAEHLTADGRGGVIVPEGIIFLNQNAYKQLRRMLVEDYVWAIVSLPAGVFNPYSGVKTCILFLDRVRARQVDEILFVKVENDGFDLGAQRREIEQNDLPKALDILRAWKKSSKVVDGKFAHAVSRKKILESSDFNLTGERHRAIVAHGGSKWPMVKLETVCEIQRGSSPRPIHDFITNDGSGVNWVKIGDAPEGSMYISTTAEKITQEGASKSRLVRKGDFVLSNSMSFGRPYIMDTEGCIHDGWLLLRPIGSQFKKEYLYYILSSAGVREQFKRLATGGVVNNLNSALVREVEIPLPPLEEQERIVAELENHQNEIACLESEITANRDRIQTIIDAVWNEKTE